MAADTAAACGDGTARSTAADGQTTESGGRPNEGGAGVLAIGMNGQAIASGFVTTQADGQPSTADGFAARAKGLGFQRERADSRSTFVLG